MRITSTILFLERKGINSLRYNQIFRVLSASAALMMLLLVSAISSLTPAFAASSIQHVVFITSAHENADFTQATFPLYMGLSHNRPIYYVITDASDSATAAQLGVNYAPKLRNALGTAAVQQVQYAGHSSVLKFPFTVDFSPQHIIVPGPTGFPPAQAQRGAVGESGYSPLIELPNGVVLNAPQVANLSGQVDKVVTLDKENMLVTYRETAGFYDNHQVDYASFDASDPGAAAIEDVTYAPNLNAAPSLA